MHVEPILPRFGAEISGVDIARPLDAATAQAIVAAQNRWGITVWRDTGLDDASHVAFSRIFGHVELAPRRPGGASRFSEPELFDASNLDAEGNIIDSELSRLINKGNRLWHTDSSFMLVRAGQSLLLCHEAPPEGGPTWFADTRSAYVDLPQATKDRIEGLEATHSYWWSRMKAGYPFTETEIDEKPHAQHPLVHVHPGSGRKALYIGAHARDVVGMPRDEGRALLRELIEWATQPHYVFSVLYQPGDMVIWDNLCSMHRGGEFDDLGHRRDMRRTTVREPKSDPASAEHYSEMFARSAPAGWKGNTSTSSAA